MLGSQLQTGWKWNAIRLDWRTDEDKIDTTRLINPKLRKLTWREALINMPEQYKRFDLMNNADCVMINSICDQPIEMMSSHNKINTTSLWGHKKQVEDRKSTPFQLLQNEECRRNLFKQAKIPQSDAEKEKILKDKLKHYQKCEPCRKTFRKWLNIRKICNLLSIVNEGLRNTFSGDLFILFVLSIMI